jgi:ribose transport system permease protein
MPEKIARALSFRNISALYIFAVMFIVFSIWVPDTFLQWNTWKALFDSQAVTAILAVGLVIALSAGAFDLAIGTELGFGAIFVGWLLVDKGVGLVPAIILTLLAGAVIGLANGILITKVRIDSFIATLGMSSVLLALIAWVSSSQQIVGVGSSFEKLGTTEIFGLTLPVYLMLLVALVVWYVLERTPLGRRVYATGGNIEAARLAGAPIWIPDLFNGVALLLAVGLAKWETTATRAGAVRRLLRFDRGGRSGGVAAARAD